MATRREKDELRALIAVAERAGNFATADSLRVLERARGLDEETLEFIRGRLKERALAALDALAAAWAVVPGASK